MGVVVVVVGVGVVGGYCELKTAIKIVESTDRLVGRDSLGSARLRVQTTRVPCQRVSNTKPPIHIDFFHPSFHRKVIRPQHH